MLSLRMTHFGVELRWKGLSLLDDSQNVVLLANSPCLDS